MVVSDSAHPTSAPPFPLMLFVADKKAVVFGGDAVAAEKARSLRVCGARVTVVSAEPGDELVSMITAGEVSWIGREYAPGDLAGARVAVSALPDADANAAIAREAAGTGALFNAVDMPALCEFMYPAVVRRGDLVLTVATSGRAPGVSSLLRRRLEAEFGPEYELWMELLAQTRCRLKSALGIDYDRRRAILSDVMDLDLLPLLRQGKTAEARGEVDRCVSRWLE